MDAPLELGIDTFGDITVGPDGGRLSHSEVLRNLVEQAVLADRVGLSFIGVGEHHREDFAVSAPDVCWRPSPAGRSRSGSDQR